MQPTRLPVPFIVGAPRSGTTLLRFMLDAHPELAIPPETGFVAAAATHLPATREELFRLVTSYPPEAPAWSDFGVDSGALSRSLSEIEPFDAAEGLRAFYRLYAGLHGKSRYGDKTPLHGEHILAIEKVLPEAAFIHLIRDGRDVALSLRSRWFAPSRDIGVLAEYWESRVRTAREMGMAARAYLEVRYEDLVTETESVLQTVCSFVQLRFDPVMLLYWKQTPERLKEHRTRYRAGGEVLVTHEERLDQQRLTMCAPQAARAGRWKREMSPGERCEFERVAGRTLRELGYAA